MKLVQLLQAVAAAEAALPPATGIFAPTFRLLISLLPLLGCSPRFFSPNLWLLAFYLFVVVWFGLVAAYTADQILPTEVPIQLS